MTLSTRTTKWDQEVSNCITSTLPRWNRFRAIRGSLVSFSAAHNSIPLTSASYPLCFHFPHINQYHAIKFLCSSIFESKPSFSPFDFLDGVRNRVVEAYPRNLRTIASGDADVRSRPWLGVPSPILNNKPSPIPGDIGRESWSIFVRRYPQDTIGISRRYLHQVTRLKGIARSTWCP